MILNEAQEKELRKGKLLAVILLIVAPVVYLLVTFIVKVPEQLGGQIDIMLYILLIIAAAQPLVYPVIKRIQLSNFRASRTTKMTPEKLFLTLTIIRLALIESAFIYGIVVYFISGLKTPIIYFYLIGYVWAALGWPRRSQLERFVERANRP